MYVSMKIVLLLMPIYKSHCQSSANSWLFAGNFEPKLIILWLIHQIWCTLVFHSHRGIVQHTLIGAFYIVSLLSLGLFCSFCITQTVVSSLERIEGNSIKAFEPTEGKSYAWAAFLRWEDRTCMDASKSKPWNLVEFKFLFQKRAK